MYWVGLLILMMVAGVEFGITIAFTVLGAGIMLFAIVRAVVRTWYFSSRRNRR